MCMWMLTFACVSVCVCVCVFVSVLVFVLVSVFVSVCAHICLNLCILCVSAPQIYWHCQTIMYAHLFPWQEKSSCNRLCMCASYGHLSFYARWTCSCITPKCVDEQKLDGKHTLQSTHQWRDFVLQMLRAQEPVFGAVTIKTSPELEETSSVSSISSIQADSNKTWLHRTHSDQSPYY